MKKEKKRRIVTKKNAIVIRSRIMGFVYFAIGLVVGFVATTIFKVKQSKARFAGTIRMDQSDPDSPYLFLELSPDGMSKIQHTDYVLLHVNLQNYISH